MAKKETDSDLIKQLEELFGKNTIKKASDEQFIQVKNRIPTGSITLDEATGGGIPKDGKCTTIIGRESSGKSTLSLHIIANEQKQGGLCCLLDIEESLDLEYAKTIGVDLDMLHIVDKAALLKSLGIKDRQVVSGEEWFELACKLLKSNIYGLIVMDSVTALIPATEIQTGIAGGRLAGVASMMAKAYRAVNSALSVSKSGFLYLNQWRMNPGGYNPLTEPGGESFKYLQSLKIEISKSVDKDSEGAYGIVVKGKITKSKVCVPYKTFSYYIEFGKGIVRENEIFDLAVEKGFIKQGGAWFTLNGDVKLQGEASVLQFLKDNPEYTQELLTKILNKDEHTGVSEASIENIS